MADEVGVRLSVRDRAQFGRDMAGARRDVEDFGDAGDSSGRRLRSAFESAVGPSKVLLGAITGLAAATGGLALKAVFLAGEWEQTEMAFTTMLGSGRKAKRFLEDLTEFAAKTPFEMEGLTTASRQLLAFGFQAGAIIPMMTSIGDAVSGLGGAAPEIDRVTRSLGQMQAKGRVQAEEMMQLAELGIPAWEYLADFLDTDVAGAMEKVTSRQVGAAEGIKAILEGMTADFGGMMEKQSGTVLGLWSTIKDTLAITLRDIGTNIIQTFNLRKKLRGAIRFLEDFAGGAQRFIKILSRRGLAEAIDEIFGEGTWEKVKMIAGAVGGMLVPAFVALGAALLTAARALAPWAILGVLAQEMFDLWRNSETFRNVLEQSLPIIMAVATALGIHLAKRGVLFLTTAIKTRLIPMVISLWATISAHPFILIAAAAAALVVLVIQHWDTIKEGIGKVWDWIKKTGSNIWNGLKDATGFVLALLLKGWRAFLSFFIDVAGGIVDAAAAAFGWVPGIGDKIKRFRDQFRRATDGILEDLDRQIDEFEGWGEKLGRNIIAVTGKYRDFRDLVNAGLSPQIAQLEGGVTSTGKYEKRALGGPMTRGRPYLVGERGPEIVVPKVPSTVIPNHMTRQVVHEQPIQIVVDRRVIGETAIRYVSSRRARA